MVDSCFGFRVAHPLLVALDLRDSVVSLLPDGPPALNHGGVATQRLQLLARPSGPHPAEAESAPESDVADRVAQMSDELKPGPANERSALGELQLVADALGCLSSPR
jgi:hypothetical protein